MSLDLGTLLAHVGLDVSGFTKGSSEVKKSADDISKSTDAAGKRAEDMQKKLAKAVEAGAIIAFGKASIQAFAESEQSSLKLQSAFEKFPKLADTNVKAIEDIASALALKTRFDDDATKSAAAQLAQFDLTGQQIQQVIPLLQDYAARTGKELPDAATSLGKAFMGQTRSLKEVGINYKSTGDQAQDFANITALLSEKVGGFAEKEGQTAAGRMQILANRFGELQEAVGQALIPALEGAMNVVRPVVDVIGFLVTKFNELPAPVKGFGLALAGIGLAKHFGVIDLGKKAVDSLKGAFTNAATGSFSLKSGMSSLAKSIGPGLGVAGAVGLATYAITSIIEEGETLKRQMGQMADAAHGLSGALMENSGAWDEASRKQAAAALEGTDYFKALHKAGADYTDMVLAATGDQDAYNRVLGQLRGSDNAVFYATMATNLLTFNKEAQNGYQDQKKFAGALKNTGDSADGMGKKISSSAMKMDDGTAGAEDLAIALDGVSESTVHVTDTTKAWTGSAELAADKQSRLKKVVDDLLAELDKLTGRQRTVEEANRDLSEATDDLAKNFRNADDTAGTLTDALVTANGTIDTTTKSGRDLYDQTNKIASANLTAAEAAYADARSKGDLVGAQAAANAKANEGYNAFMAAAKASGISEGAARTLAGAYGLLPEQVMTVIRAQDNASGTIDYIKTQLLQLDGKTITVTTNQVTNDVTYRWTKSGSSASRYGSGAMAWQYTGGFLGDLPGYARGGIVPGTPPSNPRQDNILALLNGKPLGLRSREFVVNEPATKDNIKTLEAINFHGLQADRILGLAGGGPTTPVDSYSAARANGPLIGSVVVQQQMSPQQLAWELDRKMALRMP